MLIYIATKNDVYYNDTTDFNYCEFNGIYSILVKFYYTNK